MTTDTRSHGLLPQSHWEAEAADACRRLFCRNDDTPQRIRLEIALHRLDEWDRHAPVQVLEVLCYTIDVTGQRVQRIRRHTESGVSTCYPAGR